MNQNTPDDTELRNELTAIMYGADWEDFESANTFRPDVEAAMKLFASEVARARLTERAKWEEYIDNPENNYHDLTDTLIIIVPGEKARKFMEELTPHDTGKPE